MEIINFDFSVLSNYYNARTNLALASSVSSSAPIASQSSASSQASTSELPWRREIDPDAALIAALGAASFLPNSVAEDARASRGDVDKIFAAYEALAQVKAIADAALDDRLPVGQESRSERRMLEGIDEVRSFLDSVDMEKSILITGERMSSAESEVAVQRSTYEYTTKALHDGEYDAEVAAFTGSQAFTITAKKTNTTHVVNIDLSEMEATTGQTVRNLDNVSEFINFRLEEAGLLSKFERTKIGIEDEDGVISGTEFGFKIKGVSTETLSFSAADTAPAAVLVGQSGRTGSSGGQISVWTGLDGVEPTRQATSRVGAEEADTNFTASALHPDGGYVVVGTTSGDLGNGMIRGEQDAFLARYDSQGKLAWTRTIGAATNAEGMAVAVSSTGQIALTGFTSDDLSSSAIGGQKDTYVTLFDEDGIEQWTRQRAATFDDEGTAIAFASDGGIVVGGTTASSMNENALAGGTDMFIEKLDSDGNQEWLRQFGTSENDQLGGLALAADGAVVVSSIENGEAVVRRYASNVDDAGDWSYSLGSLNGGAVGDVEIGSDGSVYVAGSTRAAGEDANGFTATTQIDRDGFVAKIDTSSASPSLAWLQRIGGDGYQSVDGLAINGDQVVATGTGEAVWGNGSSDKSQSSYISTLNQTDGTQGWTSSISGRGGVSSASDVLISDTYSSTLDAFGLPDGDMVVADTASLTDRLSLRAGDHFYLSVDGGRDRKITIEQGDNLRSLSFKVNAALVLSGNGEVKRSLDGQKLKISPAEGVSVELKPGDEGQNALGALGLTAGVLREKPIPGDDTQNDGPEIVTMGLIDGLSFKDRESRQEAVDVLDTALRGLRNAYRWAVDDPTILQLRNQDDGPGANRGGQAPAYLTAQIANLQAGLQRLSAGGGSVNFFA